MKKLFLPLTLLVTGLLGASLVAHAQADEHWYQEALRHNTQQQKSSLQIPTVPKRVLSKASLTYPASGMRIDPCDVGINGDFETQLAVPTHVNNMGGDFTLQRYGGTYQPDQLANWYSPSAGSPDYYATNADATSEVQPNNENSPIGSFTPFDVSADAIKGAIGLYVRHQYYTEDTPNSGNVTRTKYAEYARIALPNGGLTSGVRYYADYQVSLSHRTTLSKATNYGVNGGFGLLFTTAANTVTPNGTSADFITLPSQYNAVFNNLPITENAINYGNTGAANWQRFGGQFTSSGETVLTVGLFNSQVSTLLNGGNGDLHNTYFLVDAVRIFKIPTAGPNKFSCTNQGPTVIGEGCNIPGATYAWSTVGGAPFATTLQTTVNPTEPTTYILTVTLPDHSTYITSVSVSGPPTMPLITVDEVHTDRCLGYIGYVVTNFNPNKDFTYTVNILSGRVSALPATLTTNQFRIKGGPRTTGGSFSITVSGCGVSYTTSEYFADFGCASNRTAQNRATQESGAYPNPAAGSLTLPAEAGSATLIDNNGKVVKSSGKSSKLDVQDLPEGLYNLQMQQNGKLINQRIQVKH